MPSLKTASTRNSIEMTTFNINCLGLPTSTEPNPELFRRLLLAYDEELWVTHPSGGAALSAKEDGLRWSLVLTASKGLGISLLATVRGQQGKRYRELTSVGEDSKLGQFVRTECDIIASLGSFVRPEIALMAVEDFFEAPSEPSSRLRWIATSELAFPEPDDKSIPQAPAI